MEPEKEKGRKQKLTPEHQVEIQRMKTQLRKVTFLQETIRSDIAKNFLSLIQIKRVETLLGIQEQLLKYEDGISGFLHDDYVFEIIMVIAKITSRNPQSLLAELEEEEQKMLPMRLDDDECIRSILFCRIEDILNMIDKELEEIYDKVFGKGN